MTLLLAAGAISLGLLPVFPRLAPLPVGLAAGWLWGGPVTAVPMMMLLGALPLSAERWRRNRASRDLENRLLRGLEAMLERSHLTSSPDEVLEAGEDAVGAFLAEATARSNWLERSLREVFLEGHASGTPLNRPLALLLEEARIRAQLGGEIRSQNGALIAVTAAFLVLELGLAASVLAHPLEASLFRRGLGSALSAWVLLTTGAALTLPWLQSEAALW